MGIENLSKEAYDKYIRGEFDYKTSDRTNVVARDTLNKLSVQLFVDSSLIEFTAREYQNNDVEIVSHLTYLRHDNVFLKSGDFKPFVKYIRSILTVETLEKSV